MKNFNFSKVIIVALLIIIVSFSAISLTASNYKSGKSPNALIRVINDGTGTIDEAFAVPGQFLQSKINDFQNVLNTYKQNESLKQENISLSQETQRLAALEHENKELKSALNLQNSLSNYTTKNAVVINRNPSSWNDLLVIDEGANAGIKENMIVMANGGIIGRVSQVNDTTSKVELLTSSKNLANKVPIKIANGYGLLNSYKKSSGEYVITNMTASSKIKVGDDVVTSGLGGDSPSDLLLGKVVAQTDESNVANRKIYVKPTSNFYDLQFVTVVKRQVESD